MDSTSFITEVQGQKQYDLPDPHEMLIPVKTEHVKLQEVIGMFSRKVDTLVDKQRHEYTQAYEYHMFEIQKELHRLREKATAIANDTTREEKLANLNKDQKWFRSEAMRLDVETNQLRRVLRTLTGKINSVERERDWLLQKLREAKMVYSELEAERAEIPGLGGGLDGESSMASNESSYTLEMMGSRYLKKTAVATAGELPFQDPMNWKAKVNSGANFVSRSGQDATIDRYVSEGGQRNEGGNKQGRRLTGGGNSNNNSRESFPLNRTLVATGSGDPEKEARAQLVVMRTRQENCRDFIAYCGNSSASGPWSKRVSRSTGDILVDCVDIIESNFLGAQADTEGEYIELASKIESLAAELALCPETYYAISELFSAAGQRQEEANQLAQEESTHRDDSFYGDVQPPKKGAEQEAHTKFQSSRQQEGGEGQHSTHHRTTGRGTED